MCSQTQHKPHTTVHAADVAPDERERLKGALAGFEEDAKRISPLADNERKRVAELRADSKADLARVAALRARLIAAVNERCDKLSASLR